MKTFTYQECVNYSNEKNKIIRAYGNRFHSIWKYIKSCELKGITIDPAEAIKELVDIEEKFPILIGDVNES